MLVKGSILKFEKDASTSLSMTRTILYCHPEFVEGSIHFVKYEKTINELE